MTDFKRPARHRVLLAATLCASFMAAPHAQSFERVAIGARHYFECLGLLLSDPVAHEAECLPNTVNVAFGSRASSGSSTEVPPPPPASPPPVVVIVTPPPPPPPAPDACLCGSCYAT